MNLLVRLNLVLGGVFIVSAGGASYECARLLNESARQELIQQAALILDGALATRDYTTEEILPLLNTTIKTDFPPQSVPFYAATQNFLKVHARHPEYSYKEATLNPTNLRDRATDWESDLIQQFRNDGQMKEIIGERDTPMGRALYRARPIRVEPQCLTCHSTAQAAPASLIARYGATNGFGWQPDEIIGAQVVSVPLNASAVNTNRTLYRLVIAISSSLILLWVVASALLYWMVIIPLRKMQLIADRLSRGEAARDTLPTRGPQEITALAQAFERLRISLEKAMKRLHS